ncbi:MAG: flagellin, partial [Planctomycetes bacterium]|nr:flagellin [Planctomycetota bacterium]
MPASLISSQLTNILNRNNNSVSKAMKKLASGSKINQASDNPAGLIISNLLKSQISGTQRAIQNTQETSNMLDIAEGSLSQMNNILTKMKQLALHAANGGVTSSSQVSADQAEIDSAIRSLDSIARTTAYSDEKLLNGSKQISYSANVQVKNSMDMPMLDAGLTDIQQIFKRDGAHLDITFSGADASGNDNGNAAKKGYFEVTTATPGAEGTQVNDGSQGANAYTLTHDQSFTVTGNAGSYALDFAKGTHVGDVASAINNVSGSTGVKATLIFDSNASGTELSAAAQSTDWAASGRAGDFGAAGATDETKIRAFNKTANGENAISTGVSSVSLTANGAKALEVGVNLDGDGRMYLKMLNNNQYELYKDEAMTMKVGSGSIAADDTPSTVTAANNSGINGMSLQFHDSANFKAGSTAVLQFNNMLADDNASDGYDTANSVSFKGLADSLNPSLGGANMSDSFLSGVKLGYNTSDTGKLYVKATIDYASGEANSQFKIYKDAQMRDEDLVAASAKFNAADINNQASGINVYATKIGDTGQDTGLYGVINLGAYDGAAAGDKVEVNGAEIAFDNLGLRV